jgi:hypothetical protein
MKRVLVVGFVMVVFLLTTFYLLIGIDWDGNMRLIDDKIESIPWVIQLRSLQLNVPYTVWIFMHFFIIISLSFSRLIRKSLPIGIYLASSLSASVVYYKIENLLSKYLERESTILVWFLYMFAVIYLPAHILGILLEKRVKKS